MLKSMIFEFSANDILQCSLIFVFMGDHGKLEFGRGASLTWEVLTLFWKEFSIALATGASEKVPSIRHDYQKLHGKVLQELLFVDSSRQNTFPYFCRIHSLLVVYVW